MNADINVLEYLDELKKENKEKWEKTQVTDHNKIPSNIYTTVPNWIRVTGNIVAVYADMINSSGINIGKYRHVKQRGRVFDIFTGGLARIFHDFNVEHLDIEGDGALGIWNGGDDRLKAFCAAVTFRTYVGNWLGKFVSSEISDIDNIGVRIGIDEEEATVKFVGVRGEDKNLVWVGEPVPSASKLCKVHQFKDQNNNPINPKNHIVVSDRLFEKLCKIEEIEKSCSCVGGEPGGEKTYLWEKNEIPEERQEEFTFDKYFVLTSQWCDIHGEEYCKNILSNIDSN